MERNQRKNPCLTRSNHKIDKTTQLVLKRNHPVWW